MQLDPGCVRVRGPGFEQPFPRSFWRHKAYAAFVSRQSRPVTIRPDHTMSAFRLVSSVARRAPSSFVLGRRGYAEVTDKIKLSLVLPHQVCLFTLTQPAELSVTPTCCAGNLHLHRCRAGQPVSGHW
jgi:hypothetical protein